MGIVSSQIKTERKIKYGRCHYKFETLTTWDWKFGQIGSYNEEQAR
jgi:hypothetical protein